MLGVSLLLYGDTAANTKFLEAVTNMPRRSYGSRKGWIVRDYRAAGAAAPDAQMSFADKR